MNFILQETHFLAYQLIASTIKLYHLKKKMTNLTSVKCFD